MELAGGGGVLPERYVIAEFPSGAFSLRHQHEARGRNYSAPRGLCLHQLLLVNTAFSRVNEVI